MERSVGRAFAALESPVRPLAGACGARVGSGLGHRREERAMEFTAEFTVIGEDQESGDNDELSPLPPGSVFAFDQDLYEESGEGSWKQGGTVGEAHGSVVVTRRGRAMCTITFGFENGTLMVEGLLPAEGRRLDGGTLAVTGGTGDFDKSAGHVDMESRNPKRWSFVL